MPETAATAPAVREHVARPVPDGPCPPGVAAVLPPDAAAAAAAEIAGWPGYAPTPLRRLDRLADALDLRVVAYKDESARFGLGSFKALGGAYAVLTLAAERLTAAHGTPPDPAALRAGRHADALAELTVVTATDGNHGRAVAWGARMVGCRCRIYVHAGVSAGRCEAMAALGAEVARIDGDYDESVRRCAADAAANGWQVVSDTSYPGYMEIPRRVMAGYSVMAAEALDQLAADPALGGPPTHVFVQGGVGGLAAAVCALFWQRLGADRPTVVVVEPERAACLTATARAGRPTPVAIVEETVMAGLSCGAVSLMAWEVLGPGAAHYLTVGDEAVGPAMRRLADGAAGGGPVVAGESAVAGLVGLEGAARDPALRAALGLTAESRVLTLGTEGATDPAIYRALTGLAPEDVATGGASGGGEDG